VPDDVILEIYTALRPHRSTDEELAAWAERLADEYGATQTAAFVSDARAVYAERGLLRERTGSPTV
jgi:propanediol dehydratase small subunit